MVSRGTRTYVLDTNILYAAPKPFELEDLQERPALYLVPATALTELDILVQRPHTRAKARAALNVLQQYVERGAARAPVSWGRWT